MNFLAHLCLASHDDGLMMGGMLGDFVRGRWALRAYPPHIRQGIVLHRFIDRYTDHSPVIKALRPKFPREFRRYSGIIIDLAYDHELAVNWWRFMPHSLERFDVQTRDLLRENEALVPDRLQRFIHYADRYGLFSAYREKDVVMYSLAGIGTRLKRENPLHRVAEIWPQLEPEFRDSFRQFFPQVQSAVADWCKRMSTTTGS